MFGLERFGLRRGSEKSKCGMVAVGDSTMNMTLMPSLSLDILICLWNIAMFQVQSRGLLSLPPSQIIDWAFCSCWVESNIYTSPPLSRNRLVWTCQESSVYSAVTHVCPWTSDHMNNCDHMVHRDLYVNTSWPEEPWTVFPTASL